MGIKIHLSKVFIAIAPKISPCAMTGKRGPRPPPSHQALALLPPACGITVPAHTGLVWHSLGKRRWSW